MGRRRTRALPREQDSLFYYQAKEDYLGEELPCRKSKSEETIKAVGSAIASYHEFLESQKHVHKERGKNYRETDASNNYILNHISSLIYRTL